MKVTIKVIETYSRVSRILFMCHETLSKTTINHILIMCHETIQCCL